MLRTGTCMRSSCRRHVSSLRGTVCKKPARRNLAGFYMLTGAEEETRTLTPERELDPEPSVSTNFTTSAQECL
mgnify:FL=1